MAEGRFSSFPPAPLLPCPPAFLVKAYLWGFSVQRLASISEFITTWGVLPLSALDVKLDVPVDLFTADDRLLDPRLRRQTNSVVSKT